MARQNRGQTRAEKSAETRRRVLDVAAQAIRLYGTESVSVSDVMKAVGLTHGTFYAHFSSKENLMSAAVAHAADTYREALKEKAMAADADGRVPPLAAAYLTPEHAADPGNGCFIAALGPELGRAPQPVAEAFRDGVAKSIALIEKQVTEGDEIRHDRAIAELATVVGGMILARAAEDEGARDRVLRACREALADRRERTLQ